MEEACEMYTRAANMFKIAKNWSGEYSPGRSSQPACGPSCPWQKLCGVTPQHLTLLLLGVSVLAAKGMRGKHFGPG